nr:MAG TPA: hypothetical protein [Caudoviricetes sp.]
MQPLSSHERDHDQRKGHTDPLRHEGRGGVHQTSGVGFCREHHHDGRRREYRQHRRAHDGGTQRGRTTLRQRAPLYGGRRVGHLRRGAASGAGGLATLRREHLAADRKVGRYGKKRSCGGEEEVGDRRITYELWFSIAVGQMSMRPEDFEVLTPAEFIYAWLGWSEREQSLQRQSWERERWAVWVLTSIQLDRKERRAMTEMFPLPWEAESAQTPTPLTMQERRERIRQILNDPKDDENP